MFISKDLSKKCYVVTGIIGVFELDHLIDKARTIFSKQNYIDSFDLYKMVNPFVYYATEPSERVSLKEIKYWYYDYKGEDFDTSDFTLYIPYQEGIKQEKCCTSKSHSMPDISSIETYNDRVVLVRFKDGTFTKAIAMEKDPFDFDMLFTIAYMKRMLGEDGHKKYHKLIDKAHKIVKKQEKDEEEKLRKQAEQKERAEKRAIKKKAKEMMREDRLSHIIFDAVSSVIEYHNLHANNTEDDLK